MIPPDAFGANGVVCRHPFGRATIPQRLLHYKRATRILGITPIGVQKRIKDLIDGMYDADEGRKQLRAAQTKARYESMGEKDMEKELKRLEKEMQDAAKNLEFERAAELRDKLFQIREAMFGVQLPVET